MPCSRCALFPLCPVHAVPCSRFVNDPEQVSLVFLVPGLRKQEVTARIVRQKQVPSGYGRGSNRIGQNHEGEETQS